MSSLREQVVEIRPGRRTTPSVTTAPYLKENSTPDAALVTYPGLGIAPVGGGLVPA